MTTSHLPFFIPNPRYCSTDNRTHYNELSDRPNAIAAGRGGGCALKPQCTGAKQRLVSRHFEEEVLERMGERLRQYPRAMALRREIAEHPFANLKCRILGNGRFLLRGLGGAGAEMALAVLAYNFRRALNLLGTSAMRERLMARPA